MQTEKKIYSLAKHCKVFNAVPNLVNSANDQFAAEPPKLVIPKKRFLIMMVILAGLQIILKNYASHLMQQETC
ncbi:hypothetical protein [Orientia tsutsugamushi]|uniref:Uncharacterized protein n=1 Tax=Orientia tsutsugamushi TaxID=784 RepID=A0A2U3QTZ3_ORITS|nr:hypothetical protein [Orientia tsutsugamushi]KJV54756.1 hypothetical protein OTSKATO_0929 [Orientia tsutsugamushi str. Kato PP]SPR04423.1 Uncharacterised protein [Orientia tsutsugamushi]